MHQPEGLGLIDPKEALDELLQAGDYTAERQEQHRRLSEYASTVLRTKGELIRVGQCGYSERLERVSTRSGPGTKIIQGTKPLAVGEKGYITLRDDFETESKTIELAYVDDIDNPWSPLPGGESNTLAVLGEETIPIDSSYEDLVRSLITTIDAGIERIPNLRDHYYIKDVMRDHRKGLPFWWDSQRHKRDQTYNIRENPEILREIYPDSDILIAEKRESVADPLEELRLSH